MIEDQPPPIPNESTPIVDLVMDDLQERKRIGIERYGVPLQAHNGRDMLIDAYQEAMDLVIYLRGAIEDRGLTLPDHGISYNEDQRRELFAFVLETAETGAPISSTIQRRAKRLVEKYEGLPF